ncbi:hypothetical protein LEMLEM_LOCUS16127 [Lemmus lemmus]
MTASAASLLQENTWLQKTFCLEACLWISQSHPHSKKLPSTSSAS